MNAIVVFYSRTGATRKLGQDIADVIGCEVEEVVDMKNRGGPLGFILGGRDAIARKTTTIKETEKDPLRYDVVIIGTPVWAGTVTPAIRTYLTRNKEKLGKVAFYCTSGSSGDQNAFKEMEDACGRKPVATLNMTTKEALGGENAQKVRLFVDDALT